MTFVYPAVFTPHEKDNGFHVEFPDLEGHYKGYFPDLECCEADGPDLEDAVENARDAARNWITAELEDTCEIPPSTHVDDIELKEGMFIKNIMVIIKLLPDND